VRVCSVSISDLVKSCRQPLDTFYPQFARDCDVAAALQFEIGVRAADILTPMQAGQSLESDAEAVSDLIENLIQNDSLEVETFYGQGSDGFLPITICNYGPVSFIRVSAFDDIGYFGSRVAAALGSTMPCSAEQQISTSLTLPPRTIILVFTSP
jgi:hypothetical protein